MKHYPTKKAFGYTATRKKSGTFAGGAPYVSKGFRWPVNSEGEELLFLFQADLSVVPPLGLHLPQEGFLQFYHTGDDLYGMDLEDHEGYSLATVLYLPKAEDKLLSTPYGRKLDDEWYSPLEKLSKRLYLAGEEFESLPYPYTLDSESLGEDQEAYGEWYDKSVSQDYAFWFGGYPHFTQDDFREGQRHPRQLLLGSESTNGVCWGDMGAGGFWLYEDELEERRYENTIIYWDCG